MATNRVTFFPCGNGDAVFLESGDCKIMTDINYRASTQDEEADECPDYGPDIRNACKQDWLHLFVLTHPDADHCRGISEIFYLGPPSEWDDDPDDGEPLILIEEIWCSPYAANPHYVTDDAKPIIDEIKRRKKLQGTAAGYQAGNKLTIMSVDTHASGFVGPFQWNLIAPTKHEADIPKPDPDGTRYTSNPSSLGIVWSLSVLGYENRIMLLGDATVEVLERINDDVAKDTLQWGILLAPHHCSRRSIGSVYGEGTDNETFEPSEDAEAALSNQKDDGHIVASSRRFKRGGPTPPSLDAKKRYLRILARGTDSSEDEEERFHVTAGKSPDEKPEKIVFDLTRSGPTPQRLLKSAIGGAAVVSSTSTGGSYG